MSPGGIQHVADVLTDTAHTADTSLLIINADDWGRDPATTDRIFDCMTRQRVSCASGMVFMEDSARSADIACEGAFDIGLHLNFTTPFSAVNTPSQLIEHQRRVAAYLSMSRISELFFNPMLVSSFEYSVAAQMDEYERLYNRRPTRLDGHHHKHLSANVVLGKLLPAGTRVRRNFSFRMSEKGFFNCSYRRVIDRLLMRRHQLTDYFFSITPLEPLDRLKRVFSLSREFSVEVETHPVVKDEFSFLTGDIFAKLTESLPLMRPGQLRSI